MAESAPDWGAIEPIYRAGVMPLRAIGQQFRISHSRIIQYAREHEWTRDLQPKIQARAARIVQSGTAPGATEDGEIVEGNAKVVAAVIQSHRAATGRAMAVLERMVEELDVVGVERDKIIQIAVASAADDEEHRSEMLEQMHKVMSLGARAGTMHKLATAMHRLIEVERMSYGISEEQKPQEKPYANLSDDQLLLVIRGHASKLGIVLQGAA